VPLSSTGLDFPLCLVTIVVTGLLAAVALVDALAHVPFNRWRLIGWVVYPLAAIALLVIFLISQLPANPLFRLRFELSRPALDAAVQSTLAEKPPATPRWIGLFPIQRIEVDQREIRLVADACGVIDECGLFYRETPPPRPRSKVKLKHIKGHWYHLYAVF
jgi:hypothetical protein